ncbi:MULTISPECIES: hypothetical protein [unclassified Streptomyces]|uniref:hypothetical protein n=1 Tax=unclassified Streptomyces TaxID=2593676 RepID=UPI00382FCB6B
MSVRTRSTVTPRAADRAAESRDGEVELLGQLSVGASQAVVVGLGLVQASVVRLLFDVCRHHDMPLGGVNWLVSVAGIGVHPERHTGSHAPRPALPARRLRLSN